VAVDQFETWSASVYAKTDTGLEPGAEVELRLVFVDQAGALLRRGEYESPMVINEDTPIGEYQKLTVSGIAPSNAKGVMVIANLQQVGNAAGLVDVDDFSLTQLPPAVGPALPANIMIDNFDSFLQYATGFGGQVNDLGFYTDEEGTLEKELVDDATGTITLGWDTTQPEPVRFDGYLETGSQFLLQDLNDQGNLFPDLSVYVNDVRHTKIDVSCSEPIGPGLVSGDFEVISGVDLLDIELCPVGPDAPVDCDECSFRVVDLVLQYNGPDAQVRVEQPRDGPGYWYTLLTEPEPEEPDYEPFVSLENNRYLTMRYRGVSGNESFTIDFDNVAQIPSQPLLDTEFHAYNYDLNELVEAGFNLRAVSALALVFDGIASGTIEIDAMRFDPFQRPDTIELSCLECDEEAIEGGLPFDLTITVRDQQGELVTDYDGTMELSVDVGTVSPKTVSGFRNGTLTVPVALDGGVAVDLTATDALEVSSTRSLTVDTKPAGPASLTSQINTTGDSIHLKWSTVPGADGYHIYRRADSIRPTSGDIVATIEGGLIRDYDVFSEKDTPFFYHVTAFNDRGEGPISPIAVGTIYSDNWAPAEDTVDGLTRISRTEDSQLLLQTQSGDKPFTAGVNLGAASAGSLPGEVAITREQYQKWFSQMAGLGFRVIRIYTLHYPRFYEELRAYNLANTTAPLYLIHGVWLVRNDLFIKGSDPRGHDLFEPLVMNTFKDDIEAVIGAVHGDLVREPQLGQASGTYTADVSPWLFNYIIGIELDAYPTYDSNIKNAGVPHYDGPYFQSLPGATPTEIWYAEIFDHTATVLAARGRTAPLSCSNWPSTDPISHPSEPIIGEDLVGLDLNFVGVKDTWPGGFFANYHLYPYYPDAIRYDKGIADYVHNGKLDNFAGYLAAIKAHHAPAGLPVFISEFGVPSSLGNAHHGPLGRDQGDHSEQEQTFMNSEMLSIIKDLGLSGGYVFAWVDEWFKRTWNVEPFYQPADRRAYWRNQWCNEEMFGIIAQDAGPGPKMAVVVDGDDSEWANNGSKTIYTGYGDIRKVQALHDEAYLYLRIETANPLAWLDEQIVVGFDVLSDGNQGLPYNTGLHVEADHAVTFGPGLEAISYVATWNDYLSTVSGCEKGFLPCDSEGVVPGSGSWSMWQMIVNRPQNVPNFPEFGQTTSFESELFDVGILKFGTSDYEDPNFDLRTSWNAADNFIELRLPWAQLSYGGPSSHMAYRTLNDGGGFAVSLEEAPEIGISVVTNGQAYMTSGYTWQTWNTVDSPNKVQYHERFKANLHEYARAVVSTHLNQPPGDPANPWRENENGSVITQVLRQDLAAGYHFTPQVRGQITELGGFFSGIHTVKLFNQKTREVLASAEVTSNDNWQYVSISPIKTRVGETYTVAAFLETPVGSFRKLSEVLPQTYGGVTIEASTWKATDGEVGAMPTNRNSHYLYGVADITFVSLGDAVYVPPATVEAQLLLPYIDPYVISNGEGDTTQQGSPYGAPGEWTRHGYRIPIISFDMDPANNTSPQGTISIEVELNAIPNAVPLPSGVRPSVQYGIAHSPPDVPGGPKLHYKMKYNGQGDVWVIPTLREGSGEEWSNGGHGLTSAYHTYTRTVSEARFMQVTPGDGILDVDAIVAIGFEFMTFGSGGEVPVIHIDDIRWGLLP
jgi:hypothetical protein